MPAGRKRASAGDKASYFNADDDESKSVFDILLKLVKVDL